MVKKREPKVNYSSKEAAALAKVQFQQLLLHPAWMRIKKFLLKKVEFHKEELLSKDITTLDQLERIRDKINLVEQFANLPDILIGEIELNSEEEEMNLDPFV